MNVIAGKVALVTGGAGGIGLEIVKKLLDHNAKGVGIIDISESSWDSVKTEIENKYGENKSFFVKADVSEKNQLKDGFKAIVERFNNLDIVVNNAGILDEDNWERMIAINLSATIHGTYLAMNEYLPKYKSDSEGIILNVASILGLDQISSTAVYSAVKSGVIAFGRAVSQKQEVKINGIRIITMCPGLVNSNIFCHYNSEQREEFTKELFQLIDKISPTTYAGESAVKLIEQAMHGSVWVAEDNKTPYEVILPGRTEMARKSSRR